MRILAARNNGRGLGPPVSGEQRGVGGERLTILAATALAVAGCASVPTRYVQTYCISQPQLSKLKSAEPGKIGSSLTGNAQDDVKLIAGNDVELRSYSDGLLGVLGGCADPGK